MSDMTEQQWTLLNGIDLFLKSGVLTNVSFTYRKTLNNIEHNNNI